MRRDREGVKARGKKGIVGKDGTGRDGTGRERVKCRLDRGEEDCVKDEKNRGKGKKHCLSLRQVSSSPFLSSLFFPSSPLPPPWRPPYLSLFLSLSSLPPLIATVQKRILSEKPSDGGRVRRKNQRDRNGRKWSSRSVA